jgi:hypothetical protein
MHRRLRLGWLGTLALGLAAAAPAAAVSEEQFQLRTGADLVALCSTTQDDPLRVAAIHMCHGFGVATYQTLMAVSAHEKFEDFFCPPSPPPSRNQAFAAFLAWANQPASAAYLSDSPAELVGRYLITAYPCPKATAGAGGKP